MPIRDIEQHTGRGAETVRNMKLSNTAKLFDPDRFSAFEKQTRDDFSAVVGDFQKRHEGADDESR